MTFGGTVKIQQWAVIILSLIRYRLLMCLSTIRLLARLQFLMILDQNVVVLIQAQSCG